MPAPARLSSAGRDRLPRSLEVAGIVGRAVLRRLSRSSLSGRDRPLRARLAEASALGVADALEELGALPTKLGQAIASSPGLFPPVLAEACRHLMDAVAPLPAGEAVVVLERSLGAPWQAHFAALDPAPLASASIAEVHACRLHDGTEAVVKVRRPGLEAEVARDLALARRVARLAELSELGRRANARQMVEEVGRTTLEELDFTLEAEHQERFGANLHAEGENAHVTVPQVFWEHCSPEVICAERLSGIPFDEPDRLLAAGHDGILLLRRAVKAWLDGAVLHGLFHGDVHAGNLWVLDDGRVAFLDFGIMGSLDDRWRNGLRALLQTVCLDGNFSRVVAVWRGLVDGPGHRPGRASDSEAATRIAALAAPLLSQPLGEQRLSEVLHVTMQVLSALGDDAPREMLLVAKQLLYFERYAKALAPSWNLARDPFVVSGIFGDAARARADELGVDLPD